MRAASVMEAGQNHGGTRIKAGVDTSARFPVSGHVHWLSSLALVILLWWIPREEPDRSGLLQETWPQHRAHPKKHRTEWLCKLCQRMMLLLVQAQASGSRGRVRIVQVAP